MLHVPYACKYAPGNKAAANKYIENFLEQVNLQQFFLPLLSQYKVLYNLFQACQCPFWLKENTLDGSSRHSNCAVNF